MAVYMLRRGLKPNEAPNIENTDDFVGLRYAYGNQNGFVKGKGTEISSTTESAAIRINSGRLVLQGVECDIDAAGVRLAIDNIATRRYYVVYLEVNLAKTENNAELKVSFGTSSYPTIDLGDDLTTSTNGVARLPIYKFEAINGVISSVVKLITGIDYSTEVVKALEKSTDTKFQSVEERLTSLGFRQGKLTYFPQSNKTNEEWLQYIKPFDFHIDYASSIKDYCYFCEMNTAMKNAITIDKIGLRCSIDFSKILDSSWHQYERQRGKSYFVFTYALSDINGSIWNSKKDIFYTSYVQPYSTTPSAAQTAYASAEIGISVLKDKNILLIIVGNNILETDASKFIFSSISFDIK